MFTFDFLFLIRAELFIYLFHFISIFLLFVSFFHIDITNTTKILVLKIYVINVISIFLVL